jgi:hypothetical protein
MGVAVDASKYATAQRDVFGRLEQHHRAVRVRDTQDQHFRAHRTDLPRWEIRDGNDELANQVFCAVVDGQLRAAAPDAERPEIDLQFVGRFARLGEGFRCEHTTNAHFDTLEVRDVDGGSLDQRF